MIKFVAAAVWIVLATLGAVFFAFQSAGAKSEGAKPEKASMMAGLDYVKTEIISVPLIHGGTVTGYFLSRLVYTVEPKDMAKLKVPADALIADVVYGYVYGSPTVDFTKRETLDMDAFKAGVKERINKAVEFDLVKDVLVEQIDFLSKDDIRDNLIKRRTVPAKADEEKGEKKGHGEGQAAAAGDGEGDGGEAAGAKPDAEAAHDAETAPAEAGHEAQAAEGH